MLDVAFALRQRIDFRGIDVEPEAAKSDGGECIDQRQSNVPQADDSDGAITILDAFDEFLSRLAGHNGSSHVSCVWALNSGVLAVDPQILCASTEKETHSLVIDWMNQMAQLAFRRKSRSISANSGDQNQSNSPNH